MNMTECRSSLRKNQKAISPAISTVIMTAAGIVLIFVAMNFANNSLNTQMANNEFTSNKQFMLTTGQQIDDIAWTTGRTQTVTYSSKFGGVNFQQLALNYTFSVHTSSGWENLTTTGVTGIIQYKMLVSEYSPGNNYFEPLQFNGSFLQSGSSAPVTQVFCEEKLPMNDGSYTRIVVVPTMRMLTSTITGNQQNATNYYKFYLPLLENGTSPFRPQSLTVTGDGITKISRSGVDQVNIEVSFPQSGFASSFFHFNSTSITLNSTTNPKISANSVVEFYLGSVIVTVGRN
jgi:hypothetical protein